MTSIGDMGAATRNDREELDRLRAEVAAWRARYGANTLRDTAFTNSAREIPPLYTPLDLADQDPLTVGMPGAYPYTRGIHPTGYRGKL